MLKKTGVIILLIATALMVGHSIRQIHAWYLVQKELKVMKNELALLKKENDSLSQKETYYRTEDYVRREAREKLGMISENEIVFVLPELPDLSVLKPKGEKYENLPNYRQWWNLFFQN